VLAIFGADGDRYVEYNSSDLMDAPAGAVRRRAINPLGSGVAW
jgi:hypothetical protein